VTGVQTCALPIFYDETVDVVADSMVSMFAEMKTMSLGPAAAVDNLAAKLVQSLIDDRPALERWAKSRRDSPAPVEAPSPAVQEPIAMAQAPVAASEPTTAPVAAPQPQPEPKRPSKPLDYYDDQLIP
jgi:hypothetical protein